MFEDFVQMLGIEWNTIITVVPVIIFIVNFFKRMMQLKQKQLLWVIGGLSLFVAVAINYPDIFAIATNAGVFFIVSIGTWESAKALAHKVGTPSTRKDE